MKKSMKWLALLMAGAMLLPSLAACKSDGGNGDQTSQTTTTTTLTSGDNNRPDTPKVDGLSPAAVYAALQAAEEAKFTFTTAMEMLGESYVIASGVTRDGNKLMSSSVIDGESFISYFDMAQNREYIQDEYGDWVWYESSEGEMGWSESLALIFESEDLAMLSFFFEDDSYEIANGRYTVKQSALEAALGASENPNAVNEAYMTHDGDIYTYVLSSADESSGFSMRFDIVVELKGQTVVLPQATEGGSISIEGEAEVPMEGYEVEEWMDTHILLNRSFDDIYWLDTSVYDFFWDAPLNNLFDDIYDNDTWNEGKMGYAGPQGAFFWTMNEPVLPTSYVIYTGADSAQYTGRNPVSWYLLGHPSDMAEYDYTNSVETLVLDYGWVILDAVADGNMDDYNCTPYGYMIDEDAHGEYQSFCWLIVDGGDVNGLVQVNGLKLFGEEGENMPDEPWDDPWDDPLSEVPMEGDEVENWMEEHVLLNGLIDETAYENTWVGYFADGHLANLFDDIYTADEWEDALNSGRLDPDEYGNVHAGKFGYTSEYYPASFYWTMEEPVTIGSYVIYTGNDNSGNPGRNPLGWYLLGSNTPYEWVSSDVSVLVSEGWTILDHVSSGGMADVDFTPYGYTVDEVGEYRYYCWLVYDCNYLVQATGMKLFAYDESDAPVIPDEPDLPDLPDEPDQPEGPSAISSVHGIAYAEMASTVLDAFTRNFYNGGNLKNTEFWDAAEILEAYIDAYEQTGNEQYLEYIENIAREKFGYDEQNIVNWCADNAYNDDIAWACIAFTRIYLLTEERMYLDIAINNFDTMYARAASDDLGGGLWWKDDEKNTKNSCIQCPASIAACLIGKATGVNDYYKKAKTLMDWEFEHLFNKNTGEVYDAYRTGGDKNTWTSTYNQGTFIGACMLLHEMYGDQKYLTYAEKAADYAMTELGNRNGVLNCETSGADLIGFKGILTRWIYRYAEYTENVEILEWLQLNADTAYGNRNSSNLIWTDWTSKTSSGTNHDPWGLSAAMALLFNCESWE